MTDWQWYQWLDREVEQYDIEADEYDDMENDCNA